MAVERNCEGFAICTEEKSKGTGQKNGLGTVNGPRSRQELIITRAGSRSGGSGSTKAQLIVGDKRLMDLLGLRRREVVKGWQR